MIGTEATKRPERAHDNMSTAEDILSFHRAGVHLTKEQWDCLKAEFGEDYVTKLKGEPVLTHKLVSDDAPAKEVEAVEQAQDVPNQGKPAFDPAPEDDSRMELGDSEPAKKHGWSLGRGKEAKTRHA